MCLEVCVCVCLCGACVYVCLYVCVKGVLGVWFVEVRVDVVLYMCACVCLCVPANLMFINALF